MTIIHYDDLDDETLSLFNLRHVDEHDFTITRQKRGKGYSFHTLNGDVIADEQERERLLKIAVPPAYTDVLYAHYKNAHIQATGYDSSLKKQYFYHQEWDILRNIQKFTSLEKFGEKLPSFRRKITAYLQDDSNPKTMVIAAMFRILDKTGIRVGSSKAVKTNKTFGLTTLKPHHVDWEGGSIELSYTGKGGVSINQEVHDKFVIDVLEKCSELHGQQLFQHEEGMITSTHINQTIKNHFGEIYSAKDFRTWRFSCMFLEKILKHRKKDKIVLKNVLKEISEKTGNTPAVLQSSYIHPGLIKIAKEDDFKHLDSDKQAKAGLRQCEAVFYNYLLTDHAKDSLIE